MKNNISYYRHETNSHNHWKFKKLRKKYSWSGEGRFWALNNMIAESENCLLDINDTDKIEELAADLDLTPEEFLQFINYLNDAVRLIKIKDGFATTGIIQETLEDVSKKRKYQRGWAKEKYDSERGTDSTGTTEPGKEGELSEIILEYREPDSRISKTAFSNIENAKSNIEIEQRKESKESKESKEEVKNDYDNKRSERIKKFARQAFDDTFWKEATLMGSSLTTDELVRWMAKYNASLMSDEKQREITLSDYKKMFGAWLSKWQGNGYKLPEKKTQSAQPLKTLN